jgi:hypothetical protein
MTQSISAAVHIQGATIRYAEVARTSSGAELRRLGRERFEFDLMQVLWGEKNGVDVLDEMVGTVGEALHDTEASAVGLVVHPLDVYSFFVPLPDRLSDEERERRVAHQAALVTNTRSLEALYTLRRSVRTATEGGETVEWIHVLAVPQEVEARMRTLLAEVPVPEATGRLLSSEAAARLMGLPATGAEPDASTDGADDYRLAVGRYAAHTEYTLSRNGLWHHAHAAEGAQPLNDQVYYAVGMLNRLGLSPEDIGHIYVYGDELETAGESFATAFGGDPVPLDPFAAVDAPTDRPDEEPAPAYVPCIGGALTVSDEGEKSEAPVQ